MSIRSILGIYKYLSLFFYLFYSKTLLLIRNDSFKKKLKF